MKTGYNKTGYTLVELLIVIVIIGVLTTIAFVGFGKIQADSRDKARQSQATIVAEALEKYYSKNGEYPGVRAVTDPVATNVKNILSISDAKVLVMPQASPSTTNSLTSDQSAINSDPTKLAYIASSTDSSENSACKNSTTSAVGSGNSACDRFSLQWKNENGSIGKIDSRNSARTTDQVLSPPRDPIMSVTLSGTTLTGTVTFASSASPICATGMVKYKKLASKSALTVYNWPAEWESSNILSVANPDNNSIYYFYAIAACVNDSNAAANPEVADDSYSYGQFNLNARWNGTGAGASATAEITTNLPRMCGDGETARFSIWYKVNTGSYVQATTWTISPSYTLANANQLNNPRKLTFKGKVRCDINSPAQQGTPSDDSNEDALISAPQAPTLNRSQSGSYLTWTWSAPSVACPAGTTVQYTGNYEGDFPDKPAGGQVASGHTYYWAYNNGYSYGLGVTSRCGAASSKTLASSKAIDIKGGTWPSETYVEKGKLFSNYSSGTVTTGGGVLIQNAVGGGGCESGSNRRIRVDFQKNGGGSDTDGWAHGGDYIWNPGSGNIQIDAPSWFQGGDGTEIEARVGFYCQNAYGGRPGFRMFERYGTLHVVNNPGNGKPSRYQTNCNGASIYTFDTNTVNTLDNGWLHCEAGPGGGYAAPRAANSWNAWQTTW